MNANDVLAEVGRQKIQIVVDGDNLQITPPQDNTISPEFLQQIKKHKQALIAYLKNQPAHEPPPLKPVSREDDIPLSFAQQRLWFINQFEEGRDASYNLPWALRLSGTLNIPALQKTFQTIVNRHETLRTTFKTVEGKGVQVIAETLKLEFPVIDVTEDEVPGYLQDNVNHIFDLSAGPLITVRLLKLAEQEHILLINMHHIISDGWSGGVLIREMTALYSAYSKGKPSPLAPLAIQYADFSVWQREWLQGEVLEQQLNYWKQQLEGAPALLELPTDYPRPAQQSHRGAMENLQIPKELSNQIITMARRERVTLFMLLMAAFQVLLSRYSGQTDICVGAPIANRNRQVLSDLIGFFVNTLVIRTRVDNQLTFKDLLQQVKTTAFAAYRYQDLPFEQVIEALNPERSLSYAPLFQVMFALQNMGNEALTFDDLVVSPVQTDTQTAQFDLSLFLSETNEGLTGAIVYNTALFKAATIRQLLCHYQLLLKAIVENPEKKIFDFPLLTKDERHQLLVNWNNTNTSYQKVQNISQLFERQAQKTPNNVAVVFENNHLDYQSLNEQSNKLAHYLIEKGVKADARVGICVERSLEMVVGILAILKAGGAYVPLDAKYPKDRLSYMMSQADVTILLTQCALQGQLPPHKHTIYLDDDSEWHTNNSIVNNNPVSQIQPEHLAYVLFTSGSTGKPKAVAMPHQALINLIQWQLQNSICEEKTKTLQFSPISFDVSFQEIFSTWCNGGALVLISEDMRRDPFLLWDFIAEEKINRVFMPFIALQQLAEACNAIKSEKTITDLKEIITAGEQLQITPLIRKLFKQLPECKLYNHYGPSESHVVTALELKGSPETWEPLPTIGTPIANNVIYILDNGLRPVPIGVFGEIYIGGIGLARGYLGREDLTRERFIANPFGSGRLYKTGDLGRYRADGTIEYKGRVDNQLKIRGFRIELGEIENALTSQQGVQEAVVVAYNRSEEGKDKYIAAYVVTEKGVTLGKDKLEEAMQELLPEYMLPSVITFLDKLPLTPSGKIDRRSLPKPDTGLLFTKDYVAPNKEIEKKIVNVLADVLTLPEEKIGINNNFFDLGGHSLVALKATIAMREKFNIQCSIKNFYTASDIKKLAELIEEKEEDEIVSISEANLDDDLKPCGEISPHDRPENIFLTGCTGFIGRFLLRELLDHTNATIYCLVRADNDSDALARLKSIMSKWDLWRESDEGRIKVVCGDLAKQKLGMAEDSYNYLSNSIDMIFHNATHMNHLATYSTLKAANIDGLKDIIRLASTGKQKLIQYISTTGIFTSAENGSNRVDESSSIDSQVHYHSNGYIASKWVSEKLLMNARERGIPSNIYRLGFVSGDSKSGRSDSAQWLTRLMRICVDLNCAFDDKGAKWLSILPVDFVSLSVVKLAISPYMNEIFHIDSPERMAFSELIKKYNDLSSKKINILPFKEFKSLVRSEIKYDNSIYFIPFIHGNLYEDTNPFSSKMSFFIESYKSSEILKSIGIFMPCMSSQLIFRCFYNA